jgi:hypothetical protein
MLYSFDDYTLDNEHYELHRDGRLVQLAPRVFNLLAYLVQQPGRLVTARPHCSPPPASQILGAAGRHEPEPPVAAAG